MKNSGLVFKDRTIFVRRAPEPSNIFWENLSVPNAT